MIYHGFHESNGLTSRRWPERWKRSVVSLRAGPNIGCLTASQIVRYLWLGVGRRSTVVHRGMFTPSRSSRSGDFRLTPKSVHAIVKKSIDHRYGVLATHHKDRYILRQVDNQRIGSSQIESLTSVRDIGNNLTSGMNERESAKCFFRGESPRASGTWTGLRLRMANNHAAMAALCGTSLFVGVILLGMIVVWNNSNRFANPARPSRSRRWRDTARTCTRRLSQSS